MSENCSHECGSCGEGCSHGHSHHQETFAAAPHRLSKIKKVIGIVSGKGGVGKSLVTSMLAVASARKGFETAILDADITGPSIPKAFGLKGPAFGDDTGFYPIESKNGISVMSLNLLTQNETDPVVWRGPVIAGTVKQFWTDVIWGDIDYMFIDMPPGTGDVPLTVFQSIPIDGIIIVATPQELVDMIVEKAAKMADLMNIPVLGLAENMSYIKCPDCGKEIRMFGESRIDKAAERRGIKHVAKMPLDPAISALCDKGDIESADCSFIEPLLEALPTID